MTKIELDTQATNNGSNRKRENQSFYEVLKLKDVVYPLIKLRLENGLSARFWFDNWAPLGNVATLLNLSSSGLGIPQSATVASLFRNGS